MLMNLEYKPGLAAQHDDLLECVRACIYRQPRPLKAIACDMGLSQAELSRKLSENPDEPRRFTVAELESYIKATGDTTPILYLAEKYCQDNEAKERQALHTLADMIPTLESLLKTAQGQGKK